MDVSVYTYHHPQKWRDQKGLYDSIKEQIHITATKNMAEGIKDCYRSDKKKEFQYIFTIRQVINGLFAWWSHPEAQLQQYLTLSKVINDTVKNNQNLKDAFRSNTTELLDSIRSFVFSGLSPQDIKKIEPLTPREACFAEVWENLEKNDSSFNTIRKQLKSGISHEKVITKLNKVLQNQYDDGTEDVLLQIPLIHTKIILHGFYYITPEQHIFLKLLQKSGFELIFLNFYDERFPSTFDFTKAFISSRFDWSDNWSVQSRENEPQETLGMNFLNAFEEGKMKPLRTNKEIFAYDSFFDFLHEVIIKHYPIGKERSEHLKQNEKNVQLIATNADILNDILVQYYPEDFADKRNFLNYPVGQFILKIHEILQNGELILNEDILMATFSSGWLYDRRTRKNGRNYTHELKLLFPFFTNCTSLDDWLAQMNQLIEMYEKILPLFETPGDNRVLEGIRSPFAKIGYLSLDLATIKQVRVFFVLLKDMASKLFEVSSDTTSIKEHFLRLQELMREHNPLNHTVLQNEEKELIKKLNYKISQIEDEQLFLYEDLGQAIGFYLSGKFDDGEDAFIKPFIEVDGEAFKQNIHQFYLTGLDEQGLPFSEFSTPWPILDTTFEQLSKNHRVLELLILRNKSVKAISRYLLYMSLEFLPTKNLELSWIRNFLDRVDLQPAVYVHQLDLITKEKKHEFDENKQKDEKPFDFAQFTHSDTEMERAYDELKFEDILAEYVLCPRRFYYGYVVGRYPVFTEEFIHQFTFSEIIKLVKRYTQQADDEVIKFVSELFPQWTDFRKKTIAMKSIGYAGRRQDKQEVITDSISVSEIRKNFQFPGLKKDDRENLFKEVHLKKEEIMRTLEKPPAEMGAILEAKSGYNCRFCPQLDWCFEGKYALDEAVKQR